MSDRFFNRAGLGNDGMIGDENEPRRHFFERLPS